MLSTAVLCIAGHAQNKLPNKGSVGIGTQNPNASAILDVDTTGKGVLLPRMTKAQRDIIPSPANSLLIYQTDNTPGFYYYNGSGWRQIFDPSFVYIKGTNLYVGSDPGGATGDSNVVVGNGLLLNVNGYSNTAVGDYAMVLNKSGRRNTAMGYYSLFANTSALENSAYGYEALMNSNGGGFNTAIGTRSLLNNNGLANTAVGENSLMSSQAGSANTAIGAYALQATLNGGFNTGIGNQSLKNNTTGQFNTAVGFASMQTNTTGNNNTVIGDSADVGKSSFTNAAAIGYKAIATASNQVMLGNSAVTSVKAAGNIVIVSDGRFKKNIRENVPGLEFIKLLKPVTYNYNIHALDTYTSPMYTTKESEDIKSSAKDNVYETAVQQKEKKLYTGFIAQEVEAAANKLGYDFSGVYKPQNDKDAYGLSYADFVVPLVKAVQELSDKNDRLTEEIEQIKNELSGMKANSTSSSVNNAVSNNKALLGQNQPNPFSVTTTLNYNLPQSFSSAKIVITDSKGKTLKEIDITGKGKGSLQIDAASFSSGVYNYSLYIDGRMIGSKQMIAAK